MLRRRRRRVVAAPEPKGVVLGRRELGEAALPLSGGSVVWPFEMMRRHAVIFGGSGTGKTETALGIVEELVRSTDAQVFYLDAKGSSATAERFVSIMDAAGRDVRVFPNEPFDAWQGDWRGIFNRLLEVVQYTREGPAAYYRDIAKTALRLACNHPDGPPRSSVELLARLHLTELEKVHGKTSAVGCLTAVKVSEVRIRYEAFFGELGRAMDGDWSWGQTDAGYLLLDSAAMGENAAASASMLFADFANYFHSRKDPDRFCVLLVDEFSAIAGSSDIAMKIEQAREFETALVLMPQTVSGMGGQEQRDRILGSVELVMMHASNEPAEIAALAGTTWRFALTHRFEEGIEATSGTARLEERPKVDENDVRELKPGTAWVIRRGRAAKVAVKRASQGRKSLPEAVALDAPLERPEEMPQREIAEY